MLEFPITVAVASKDGISINEHFGHATQFHIYTLSPDNCEWLELRDVANYCLGHQADESTIPGILETIKDCHAVFVARIGDGPTNKVRAIGVQAVSAYAYAAVTESLLDYAAKVAAGEDVT